MKREEKLRLENEIVYINNTIQAEEKKIRDTPKYKEIEDKISKIKEDRQIDSIEHTTLTREVYKKYGIFGYSYYYRFRLSDIRSSIKQGIKVGLGMKTIESIKDNIVRIVKVMIAEELKNPKIEKLKQKLLELDKKIQKLRDCKEKLIFKDTNIFLKQRKVIYDKLDNPKPNFKSKKIEKQIKEANEKIKNLPLYMPKIIKEVNRRLILDGVSG